MRISEASDASVQMYLSDVRRVDLLDDDGHRALAASVGEGRVAWEALSSDERPTDYHEIMELERSFLGGLAARETLVGATLPFVVNMAKRIASTRTLDFLDLIQEGNIGLMHAVEKYDPSRGSPFLPYAKWWIRQSISKAIDDQDSIIRIPRYLRIELRAEGSDVSDVAHVSASLDGRVSLGDDRSYHDIIDDPAAQDDYEAVKIGLGFYGEKSVEDILAELGIPRSRYFKQRRDGLRKLRESALQAA